MRIMLCVALLALTGCNWTGLQWKPKAKTDEQSTKQTQKQDVEADVDVTLDPTVPGIPGKDVTMDFFGSTLTVPSNAKVTAKVTSDYSNRQTDWSSVISNFDAKTGTGQIVFIGAVCLAAAAALCYFGLWNLGLAVAAFGAVLLGCGVLVTQYPWLILLVLGCGVLGVGAFVYYTIKHKKKDSEASDLEAVLTAVCARIDTLKQVDPAAVKTYITDALAKSHDSKLIATLTKKVREL